MKTEKGTQVSEYVKNTISPQIVVLGGATLERPEGWLVLKVRGSDPKLKYDLIRFGNKKISLWSIPIKDLNVSKAVLTLDNQIIGNKILDQIKQLLVVEKSFKVYKPQPVKIMTLGNRHWGEYDHVLVLGGTAYFVWKNVYTIYDDYILVVSRKYRFKYKHEDIRIEEDLLKEDKEMQNIILTIRFP